MVVMNTMIIYNADPLFEGKVFLMGFPHNLTKKHHVQTKHF